MTKENKFLIFKISWIILFLGIMCDYMLEDGFKFFYFNLKILSSSVVLITYIIIFLSIIPLKDTLNILKNYENKKIVSVIILLLVAGFISSLFSNYPNLALSTMIFRYSLFFIVFICTIVYSKYFEESINFLIRSFIILNLFLVISCLLDFYVPDFNQFLIDNLGHMKTEDSFFKIGGIIYLRPAGFLTETNLTAYSIAFSNIIALINIKKFKYKKLAFVYFLLSGYVFGMLGSRSALIFLLVVLLSLFIFKIIARKIILTFMLIFFLIQILTPQTQARIRQLFDKEYMKEEISVGRLAIWAAALEAFKTSPVIGIGTDLFYKESVRYLAIIREDSEKVKEYENIIIIDKGGFNPHSLFMTLLTENGIIGLMILITLLYMVYRYLSKENKKISLIIFIGILITASISSYAPYYKYFMICCIIFFVSIKQDLLIESVQNGIKQS